MWKADMLAFHKCSSKTMMMEVVDPDNRVRVYNLHHHCLTLVSSRRYDRLLSMFHPSGSVYLFCHTVRRRDDLGTF